MAGVSAPSALRLGLELVLRPYAQLVFSSSLITGAAILAAVAVFPKVALATLVAVVVAHTVAWLLGLGLAALRRGSLGCHAILTTLATAYFLGVDQPVLLLLGAVLAVVYGAALESLFARVALPVHALPFVAASWTIQLTARMLPATAAASPLSPWTGVPASWFAASWLDTPATVVFLYGSLTGGLIVLAILLHSRIALLLGAVGIGAAALVHAVLRPAMPWTSLDVMASFNALLTAMAIGGLWCVPSRASMVLGAGAAAMSVLVTYALTAVVQVLSLPVLSLPFSLTVLLVLSALRGRQIDRNPATAIPGENPEATVSQHLLRIRRFGDVAWLPFRLPFRGTWLVTQGHDGAHTHQRQWRYAHDFEVVDADGRSYDGEGRDVRDYRCYGLPVLAAGTGTVEQVVSDIPDNPIGGINAKDNWGNVVVIAHGSNLYSVCAHLQPRSTKVKVGDLVKAGTEIGRCGNSGRSPIPHLHFHVQRGAALGSDTLSVDFGDVVMRHERALTLAHRVVPREGDRVRPVLRDDDIAECLQFAPGSAWEFADERNGRREAAMVEVDLFGRRLLRSERATILLEPYEAGLIVVDFSGHRESLLRVMALALSRVPFDRESSLEWTDRVPRRLLDSWRWSLADDLIAVVAPRLVDVEVTYTARRSERALVVDGHAQQFTSRAEVALDGSSHRFVLRRDGHDTAVTLTPTTSSRVLS